MEIEKFIALLITNMNAYGDNLIRAAGSIPRNEDQTFMLLRGCILKDIAQCINFTIHEKLVDPLTGWEKHD